MNFVEYEQLIVSYLELNLCEIDSCVRSINFTQNIYKKMASKSTQKVVNVMGVQILCDGTLEEFVIPRNKINIHSFSADCLSGICEYVEGEGNITLLAQMEFQQSNINIFAWQKGGEKIINKYDYFPPPIDSDTLYGSIFVFRTNRRSGQGVSLTSDLFERYVETCHRGFEDLGSDDSEDDEDDEDEMPTAEDIEFIDNRTLEEIEDDASISDEESDLDSESGSEAEEEAEEEAEDEAEAEEEPEFE